MYMILLRRGLLGVNLGFAEPKLDDAALHAHQTSRSTCSPRVPKLGGPVMAARWSRQSQHPFLKRA